MLLWCDRCSVQGAVVPYDALIAALYRYARAEYRVVPAHRQERPTSSHAMPLRRAYVTIIRNSGSMTEQKPGTLVAESSRRLAFWPNPFLHRIHSIVVNMSQLVRRISQPFQILLADARQAGGVGAKDPLAQPHKRRRFRLHGDLNGYGSTISVPCMPSPVALL